MKKIFLFVVVLALVVSSICTMAIEDMPKIYLAIGDSITTGYGLPDTTKGFAAAVLQRLIQ